MVRGVVFDVGGTLVRSHGDTFEVACAEAAAGVFCAHGFRGDAETLRRDLTELRRVSPKEGPDYRQIHTTAWALRETARRYRLETDTAFLKRAEEAFVTPEAQGWRPLPGIHEVLDWLHGRVKLGVVSNTRSHLLVERTLEHLGVRALFDPVVTSAECGWRKPSPHIFGEVLDAWGLSPEQIVMIGDSPTKDVAGAKALGMRTVWLKFGLSGSASADAEAATPLELPGILAAWGVPN